MIEHVVTARVPELLDPTSTIEVPLHIRVDPLTGRTSRLITGAKLAPATRPDLAALTATPAFCPFCADRLETATGTFAPEITDEGRIRRGSAVVVPNVLAYSEFSSVGIYDAGRHFVDLPDLTPTLVGDLLEALVAYTRRLHGVRPLWSSINANYLPPAGSSLVHPHAQSAHDDVGTTVQRLLVDRSESWPGVDAYWRTLLDQERDGARWLSRIGRTSFLTPWAPVGFHEVWAVVEGVSGIEELRSEDCADLGTGLSAVLAAYHDLNLTSFNWALYGGGPRPSGRSWLLLKVVSRANAEGTYRSDVTFFEKLHAEAMVDVGPEGVAQLVRPYFPNGGTSP